MHLNAKWRSVSASKGIIVASDKKQEWMLPWWWKHYSRYNTLPVTFIDYGMSKEAKSWCIERGKLLPLEGDFAHWKEKDAINPRLIALWETRYGSSFWAFRKSLFFKPFALLLSSYQTSLWLDLDCQVRDTLLPLFETMTQDITLFPVSVPPDPEGHIAVRGQQHFNSGVILYQHGVSLIALWADAAIERAERFVYDDHLLSRIIFEERYPIAYLPAIYNWSLFWGINTRAKIVHLIGEIGKEIIRCESLGLI